jgi:hypothetical protein
MLARALPLAMTDLRRSPSLLVGLALCLVSPTAWAAPPEEVDASAPEPAPTAEPETTEAEPAEAEPPAPEIDAPVEDEAPPETGSEQGPSEPAPVATEPVPDEPPKGPPTIGDKHSVQYQSLMAPRINPLGLEERLWIGYQYRLYNKDKTILNGSNLAIFFRPILNPAVALIGATVQVQPAAVLRLRATYSFMQWFGTFQFVQSYESPYDDYSEQRLDEQADANQNYVTNAHQIELEALIQAKVKGLVFRSATFGIYNYYPSLRGDDDVLYDPRFELMVPGQGWMLANDTDLLWLTEFKGDKKASMLTGMRVSTLMPFFKDEVYEEGDTIKNPVGPQLRMGPVLGYTFFDRPWKKFNKPTLLLMPQWNVLHRWRTGRDVITAYPTIIIAFAFSGQLWGKS